MQPFNAELHDKLVRGMRLQPVAEDGLTHKCVTIDDHTAPKCGDRRGTRLHNYWEFVNCPKCRATPNTAT